MFEFTIMYFGLNDGFDVKPAHRFTNKKITCIRGTSAIPKNLEEKLKNII